MLKYKDINNSDQVHLIQSEILVDKDCEHTQIVKPLTNYSKQRIMLKLAFVAKRSAC